MDTSSATLLRVYGRYHRTSPYSVPPEDVAPVRGDRDREMVVVHHGRPLVGRLAQHVGPSAVQREGHGHRLRLVGEVERDHEVLKPPTIELGPPVVDRDLSGNVDADPHVVELGLPLFPDLRVHVA